MPKLIQINETVTACRECRYIRHMGSHFLPRCSETPQKIEIADASTIPDWCTLPDAPAPALLDDVERLIAENAQLRAELREALLEIAGTPPEYLSEMEEPRLDYVTIQVNKKDYEAAQTRLTELEKRA